jgi:hypothetical protein
MHRNLPKPRPRKIAMEREAFQTASMVAALVLLTTAVGSGCAWRQHARPLRDEDRLVLESMVVRLPSSTGWSVSRRFEAEARLFSLRHTGADGQVDARIEVVEVDGAVPPKPPAELRAALATHAAMLIGDPAAEVVDLPPVADPRFGPSAVEVGVRATESDAHAGILVKRSSWDFSLAFVSSTTPARTCLVTFFMRQDRSAEPVTAEARWRDLLAGIELRNPDPARAREAARADDFPKEMQDRLARRSLTLPRGAFQWSLSRERWLDHGGFDGTWGLSVGITDRLQLSAPAFLKYSFGEAEALRSPEYAIGVGWNHFTHDVVAGSTWGFGLTAQSRKRLDADISANADLLLEWLHESQTGRDRGEGQASAGILWDPLSFMSLGVEAGYLFDEGDWIAWVGGQTRPLVTLHLAPLDVGLDAAAVWDGRTVGVLAGFSLRLTL